MNTKKDSAYWLSHDELDAQLDGSGVLWLRLNRPNSLNAVTSEMVYALTLAVDKARHDPAVRVVVLTGNGRAFCAGADLKQSEQRNNVPRANVEFIRLFSDLTLAIEASPRPFIAAINGTAVAGGLELVLACDMAFAARSAELSDGHANYALFPGAGATVRLSRRIGLPKAKELMFSGKFISAKQALDIGLVDHVIDDAMLLSSVAEFAVQLATKSPLLIGRLKEAINDSASQSTESALRRERELNELHGLSHDRNEGLAAFRENRPPVFLGR